MILPYWSLIRIKKSIILVGIFKLDEAIEDNIQFRYLMPSKINMISTAFCMFSIGLSV